MTGRFAAAVEDQRRTEQHNDVFRAIGSSAQPPTKRELALETNRSKRQVQRILADLREHGRVRQTTDDDDARVVRYEIAAGGTDQ